MTAHRTAEARVFLHIGEPKTGTTFIQQVMWGNRAELAAEGVVLPGHHPQDHFRASQAQQAGKTAVISHELLSAADAGQAARAVASLQPAEVHVVLTVRDMATLLPAEWQETVKHRNARSWEDWLGDVIDRESADDDRRKWWFWRVHDTMAILRLWAGQVPPERIHVIPTPSRGSAGGLLWERFATVLGIDPGSADLSRARPNASLGMAEIEFLRRLNQALPGRDTVPDWFYMWNVKEAVAHRALADRPRGGRLILPADRDAWAKEQSETLIAGLRESGYHIAGDLDDLRPPQVTEPVTSPSDQPAEAMLDAAVQAAAALVVNQYQREYPAARPRQGHGRGLAGGWVTCGGRRSSRAPAIW